MNSDILFFFGEHMDALPLYERLEDQILTQIPTLIQTQTLILIWTQTPTLTRIQTLTQILIRTPTLTQILI